MLILNEERNQMNTCFACNQLFKHRPRIADTQDGQTVYIGNNCYQKIKKAGYEGYQPPKGGPKLFVAGKFLLNEKSLDGSKNTVEVCVACQKKVTENDPCDCDAAGMKPIAVQI